ncbi:unnamed protein product [Pleuronectes platessa]|uniref:Uncharacterized protein n=1 Tax=Pleuronectes platessa TaxID=8262 RepID=A0A9N7Z6X7_PLEPL|nr:unnamed protein product [Pleuronectes platessa]
MRYAVDLSRNYPTSCSQLLDPALPRPSQDTDNGWEYLASCCPPTSEWEAPVLHAQKQRIGTPRCQTDHREI